MKITFTTGQVQIVHRVVFDVVAGRVMIGIIEKTDDTPVYQCVEEVSIIESI